VTQHSGHDRLHEQHGVSQTCGPQMNAAMGSGKGKRLFPLGPTQPSSLWVPGVKWPGREADISPTSSAEVTNGGAITPLHHRSSWRSA
jgi:hypothetical protein